MSVLKIGIIGYGGRMAAVCENFRKLEMDVEIAAIFDSNNEEAEKRLENSSFKDNKVSFYEDADEMLSSESLDGVMIGTRCSSHTDYAIKVLQKGVPLFLEKPVSINMEQLNALRAAYQKFGGNVVVSFPLRNTPIVLTAKEIIDSGKIGRVEQAQAVNNVNYGGVYFHNWYRNEAETGGLFLQKATHDFDYVFSLMRKTAVEICAMESKRIFTGDRPDIACKDCDEYYTCCESPYHIKHFAGDWVQGDRCCYSDATGNHDSASAIIRFDDGSHFSYSQNFFIRRGAAQRGAKLLGEKGTISFDWQTNEVRVDYHHTPKVEIHKCDVSGHADHGGGDAALVVNFYRVMRGIEASASPLEDGLMSALACIKAKKSAQNHTFEKLSFDSN